MKFLIKTDSLLKHIANMCNGSEIEEEWNTFNKEKVKRSIYVISKYGWYLDLNQKGKLDINYCLNLIYKNSISDLDNQFIKHFNPQYLKEIKQKLIKNYPSRKPLFEELFDTFSKGYYFATITIGITQVDGICHDMLGAKFFMNNKEFQPEVFDKMKEKGYLTFIEFLLSPIKFKTPINAYKKNLENYPIRFNRHEIIHGVDIKFGNKINAVKVISMLVFIDYTMQYFAKIK